MPDAGPPRPLNRRCDAHGLPFAATLVALTLLAGRGFGHSNGGTEPLPALTSVPLGRSAPPAGRAASEAGGGLPGAVRAVRSYYGALNDLRREMRAAPLAHLLTADCPCRSQVRAIGTAIRHHWRYTDQVRILTALPHLDRAGLADVFVALDIRDGGLVDAAGRPLTPVASARGIHRELLLRLVGQRWLIERVIAV